MSCRELSNVGGAGAGAGVAGEGGVTATAGIPGWVSIGELVPDESGAGDVYAAGATSADCGVELVDGDGVDADVSGLLVGADGVTVVGCDGVDD
ncbi:hypothetical protein GOOTI_206_00430 [Gordonia otitidis NBRC 100426]|uniref:Uncharacterized protein n=1 Tax=Gordonia otitidis (strain DSM 44809 / CCUG 52243 / JCM 12355 / NBRC 100426 / IFM 10032) TaxID=1108044 RepID=H5TS52_GORO1|nr:hypothetical protein GOOTI_206_00430 [Gordonia otitidis NBRC 100426]